MPIIHCFPLQDVCAHDQTNNVSTNRFVCQAGRILRTLTIAHQVECTFSLFFFNKYNKKFDFNHGSMKLYICMFNLFIGYYILYVHTGLSIWFLFLSLLTSSSCAFDLKKPYRNKCLINNELLKVLRTKYKCHNSVLNSKSI